MIVLIGVLFFIFAAREILFWVSLWQLKEYRLDRMVVHLRDTQQGRQTVFSFELLLLTVLLVLYIPALIWEQYSSVYFYIIFFAFLYEFFITVKNVFLHRIKKPILTGKSLCIIFLSLITIVGLLLLPLVDFQMWIIILGITLPFIVALYIFLFSFPTEIYTDLYLQKASKKRDSLKNITVIAVSGSYGKSSTKEIIAHVLSQKYNVEKTLLSQNTPLAVAGTVLNKVTSKTDFLIAELGAYKKGEIAQMAKVVKPTIGVTTAISDQHLALYGSMKDVVESELELVRIIPKKGFVLFNGNSKNIHLLANKTTRQIFWYKTSPQMGKQKNTIVAYEIQPSASGVTFKITYGEKHFLFHSPLLGIHTVENILPAIFLAIHFGLSEAEIAKGISTLKPLSKTMESKNILPGITTIDDTFNESPESVVAAVAYLNLFSRRKIIVMSPLIELGKNAKERHLEIGKILADIDIVLLTNKNFFQEIQLGIESRKSKTTLLSGTYTSLAEYIKTNSKKGDVIIFEGKEAGIVLSKL